MVGRSAASRGPSDARNKSALSSSRSERQTWRRSGDPISFGGLDDELGIEAEPAATGFAHRAERGQIDAVLSFVVGGTTAVPPIARRCRPPGIDPVAPLAGHALDHVTVPVHQNSRS